MRKLHASFFGAVLASFGVLMSVQAPVSAWGLSDLDPTNPDSAVNNGLEELDPFNSDGAVNNGLEEVDPWNPNADYGGYLEPPFRYPEEGYAEPDELFNRGMQSQSFNLINNSGQTVNYLFVSPATDNSWGNDVLGSSVLQAGYEWSVQLHTPSSGCAYDIRAVLADGSERTAYSYDVCSVSYIYIQ